MGGTCRDKRDVSKPFAVYFISRPILIIAALECLFLGGAACTVEQTG